MVLLSLIRPIIVKAALSEYFDAVFHNHSKTVKKYFIAVLLCMVA